MPRYEPKRNAEPLVKPGGLLKMRRAADGTFKPVTAEPVASDEPAAEARPEEARGVVPPTSRRDAD